MIRHSLATLETFYQWHRSRLLILASLTGLMIIAFASLGVMQNLGWLATPDASSWTSSTLLLIYAMGSLTAFMAGRRRLNLAEQIILQGCIWTCPSKTARR